MKRKADLFSSCFLSFGLVTLLTAQAIGQTLSLVGSSRCDDLRRVQRRNDFAGNTVESIPALNGPGSSQRNDPTVASSNEPNKSAPIPMDQLGAVAGKQYHGDGLSVTATPDGARLRCAFQRLEGQVTHEGLWLSSTADSSLSERFRVMAVEVGRTDDYGVRRQSVAPTPLLEGDGMEAALPEFQSGVATSFPPQSMTLPVKGSVLVKDHTARFIRDGLTEEYTVSVDGVRQDFIVEQRPGGEGELRVELDVTGAKAEPLVNGARPVRYPAGGTATEPQDQLSHGVRLVLDGSGRKLAYNRLRVVDATGRELPARMEVAAGVSPAVEGGILPPGRGARTMEISGFHCDPFARSGISAGLEASALRQAETPAATRLAVLVDDTAAIYPVRIDPTFSDANWMSMGGIPGVNGLVFACVVDGSGNLYIGGVFNVAGEIRAYSIARWDGSSWSSLGSGMNSSVYALAMSGNDLYAGGAFTTVTNSGGVTVVVNRIAKWNGSAWSALGSGVDDNVLALAVSDNEVYAGGAFTIAGGRTAKYIAKWDGNNWTALGAGMGNTVDPVVQALALSGTNLYAGGRFTTAGGSTAKYIAKWNGSSWSALGSGMSDPVNALSVFGTNLYAGGDFVVAGGIVAYFVAKWDGSGWSALGSGLNNRVYSLAISGSNIYAGSGFGNGYVAEWNGNAWSTLGSGLNDYVYALAVSGTNLYAAGSFGASGGIASKNVAKWNGSDWSALGSGFNNSVRVVAISGNVIYAGGEFTTAGSVTANRIAKWDGNLWSALGSGMNNLVNSLAVAGTNLYAGGLFTTAGGSAASYVAKWDGNTWSALGSGMNNWLLALTVSGTNLYAGGFFSTADGMTANNIAKWDGSAWSALGSGMNNVVSALAVSGTDMYAGGSFTTAGGITANYVAKWDGNSWSALGSGVNNIVHAVMVSDKNLYAGGNFTSAGGNAANHIASWSGSSWSALGSGIDGSVLALVAAGTDLYAGGYFTTAGGNAANRIARWDGNTWSNLGTGMNNPVNALAMFGTNLFAGGNFTVAGDKVSAYMAMAKTGAARGRFSNMNHSPATGFSCTFLDGSVGQPYRIQTSPSLAAGPWTDFTNFTYTVPVVINVPAAAATNQFFRAITP